MSRSLSIAEKRIDRMPCSEVMDLARRGGVSVMPAANTLGTTIWTHPLPTDPGSLEQMRISYIEALRGKLKTYRGMMVRIEESWWWYINTTITDEQRAQYLATIVTWLKWTHEAIPSRQIVMYGPPRRGPDDPKEAWEARMNALVDATRSYVHAWGPDCYIWHTDGSAGDGENQRTKELCKFFHSHGRCMPHLSNAIVKNPHVPATAAQIEKRLSYMTDSDGIILWHDNSLMNLPALQVELFKVFMKFCGVQQQTTGVIP